MRCEKCAKKNIDMVLVTEKKCKSCKKIFKGRFTNICYTCQQNKFCLFCGKKLLTK